MENGKQNSNRAEGELSEAKIEPNRRQAQRKKLRKNTPRT